ncbi:MAG: choice-of-anchor tandem repeat GloVer-containing protein, partial [Chlamydiota bacterium]
LCLAAGASAQTYTVLHNFAGGPTDGSDPVGGVVSDGVRLYGVTDDGGVNDKGILYSMNMDGSGYTVLHEFGNAAAAANPNSLPLLNGDILYGTTYGGGAFGLGTIYRIKTDGTMYNSRPFNVPPDGARPVGPLAMSSDTVYGMCEEGGTFSDGAPLPHYFGTAFSIKTNGTGYTVFHNFAGSPSDGENPLAGFLLDGGMLYGTTDEGGAYLSGDGTVFSLAPDGSSQSILHSFSFGDGAGISSTLISDGSRLYGTTAVGGSATSLLFYGGGTVFAVDKDGSDFQTLYNLDFASGGMPGNVVQNGERLYGFAGHGGSGALFNGGVIFTLNIDGTGYTALRQFDNLYSGTGAYPMGTPLLVNGTLYGITDAGGTGGEGVVFSYVIPTPPLMVTLSTIFPAAGSLWTIDVAVQPLTQRFDAWAVIQGPDGTYHSMVLGQPGRLIPGAAPLARNVPGLPSAFTAQLLSMTLPTGLPAGAYTVIVALLPAGSPPSLEAAIAGYGVQRIATIR